MISSDERLSIMLSRFLEDGDVLLVGFGDVLPVAAGLLARNLHAPGLTLVLPCGAVNPEAGVLHPSAADFRYLYHCECRLDGDALHDLAVGGGTDVALLTGVEIDKFGNINQVQAGSDWSGPAEGAADAALAERAKRTILYLRNHSSARLVENVAHLSLVGHIDGRAGRAKRKIESQGPLVLLTDLGVFDFDDESTLRLRTVNQEHNVAEVAERTGFMLQMSPEVRVTEEPTEEELEVLRQVVDTGGLLRREEQEISSLTPIFEPLSTS